MRRSHPDSGFTLIELLIGIVIAGIIATGIGAAVSSGFSSTDTTNLRLSESHDAEFSARWFSGDAASTDLSHFSASASYALPCTDGVAGNTNVVTFGWTEEGQSQPSIYEWVRRGTNLMRISCLGTSYTGELTMSTNLSSATLPAVSCTPTANCGGTSVKTVSIVVTTAADPKTPTQPFSYTLTGTLRDTAASTGGTQPPVNAVPLFLLGPANAVALTISGNGALTVNGRAESLGGTCMGSGKGKGACPTLDPGTADPLANLGAPSTAGLSTYTGNQGDQGCGIYTGTLSFSGNQTHTLNAANKPDCVYYLQAGMTVSGNGPVMTSSAGVLIYLAGGYTSGKGKNATFTAFDCSGTASCSLTPIADENSPYHNVVIFASRTLKPSGWPNPIYNLNIQGNSTNTYQGVIYAPVENVTGTGTGALASAGIITYNMTVTGTSGTVVGCPASGC
jgi:prepilin-type N-terminal cleavage/methylation domain-containing protein